MPEWQTCGDISEARARAERDAQNQQYSQPVTVSTPPAPQSDTPKEK